MIQAENEVPEVENSSNLQLAIPEPRILVIQILELQVREPQIRITIPEIIQGTILEMVQRMKMIPKTILITMMM